MPTDHYLLLMPIQQTDLNLNCCAKFGKIYNEQTTYGVCNVVHNPVELNPVQSSYCC